MAWAPNRPGTTTIVGTADTYQVVDSHIVAPEEPSAIREESRLALFENPNNTGSAQNLDPRERVRQDRVSL